MLPRGRLLAYGSAAALVLAGALSAMLLSGLTGQLLTTVLLSLGLGGAVLLVFLEVGLSEDRERGRQAREPRQDSQPRRDSRARARKDDPAGRDKSRESATHLQPPHRRRRRPRRPR